MRACKFAYGFQAQEIYKNSAGKQQVLPLDSIYRKNLPDWNKPLPHSRIRPNMRPAGNPVYARNLLGFPRNVENCKIGERQSSKVAAPRVRLCG